VLPVLSGSDVVFWQARSLDKHRLPKYLAPDVSKSSVIPQYGNADVITLTEDILSAYKVGKVGEGWCMMGTSPSKKLLGMLAARGCAVNVWLDPDAAGRKAVAKIMPMLRAFNIEARDIVSDCDPKLVHLSDMKGLL
jgi:DNA primase